MSRGQCSFSTLLASGEITEKIWAQVVQYMRELLPNTSTYLAEMGADIAFFRPAREYIPKIKKALKSKAKGTKRKSDDAEAVASGSAKRQKTGRAGDVEAGGPGPATMEKAAEAAGAGTSVSGGSGTPKGQKTGRVKDAEVGGPGPATKGKAAKAAGAGTSVSGSPAEKSFGRRLRSGRQA